MFVRLIHQWYFRSLAQEVMALQAEAEAARRTKRAPPRTVEVTAELLNDAGEVLWKKRADRKKRRRGEEEGEEEERAREEEEEASNKKRSKKAAAQKKSKGQERSSKSKSPAAGRSRKTQPKN